MVLEVLQACAANMIQKGQPGAWLAAKRSAAWRRSMNTLVALSSVCLCLHSLPAVSGIVQSSVIREAQRGMIHDSEGKIGYVGEDGESIGISSPTEGVMLENDEVRGATPAAAAAAAEGDDAEPATTAAKAKESATLKAQGVLFRELEVCTNGLKAWSTDWNERTNAVFAAAGHLPVDIDAMKAAGVPLHKSFVSNAFLLQLALYRLGTWGNSVLASPYFQLYSFVVANLAQFVVDASVELKLRRSQLGIAHPMKKGKSISMDLQEGLAKAKKKAGGGKRRGGFSSDEAADSDASVVGALSITKWLWCTYPGLNCDII